MSAAREKAVAASAPGLLSSMQEDVAKGAPVSVRFSGSDAVALFLKAKSFSASPPATLAKSLFQTLAAGVPTAGPALVFVGEAAVPVLVAVATAGGLLAEVAQGAAVAVARGYRVSIEFSLENPLDPTDDVAFLHLTPPA